MYAALSEAKNATAAAISSGLPILPSGMLFKSGLLSPRFSVMSVWIKPGATALQVMPREASSRATDFVRPMTPAFEAD